MQPDQKTVILGELSEQFTSCVSAGDNFVDMARAYREALQHNCSTRANIPFYVERMTQFPELSQAGSVLMLLSKWKADPLGADQEKLGRQLFVLKLSGATTAKHRCV